MVLGGAERRIGLDGIGVDAARFGDALGERRELDRLEEGDELLRVEVAHARGGERGAGIDVVVQRHQIARQARLVGDTSDNVPGVPGIGIKTASALIGEYGDLDTLLANAESIKQPKRRELLTTYADQARMSRPGG